MSMDETEKKKNIEKFLSENNMAEKIFLAKQKTNPINSSLMFKKRLNDFDSSLFEKTSIEKIDDPELKLETKIEKLEEMISVLEEKLVVAETVQDTMKAKEIFIQKLMLEKKLEKMREEYKKNGFDSKLTENIMSFFGLPQNIENDLKQKAENFMKNSALARPFKPVMNFFKVKETLNRLDKINKSVDELVNMQVPFGEGEQRYQALANHLTRATYLQNKIEKNFKG